MLRDATWLDQADGEGEKITAEATWVDDSPALARHDIDLRVQQVHNNRMQLWALLGVGGVFLLTLVAVVAGPAVGAISEGFAGRLADMIFPVLLTAGASIIGTLFVSQSSTPTP